MAHVLVAPVPDGRRHRQRGADVLPDVVDLVLRTDPHRHRDRDHQAQALRHRRTDQSCTGGRGARRVRHRAVRRHRGRRRHADRAAPAVGLAVGPGDRPGRGAVPAGAGARAPARQPARLRLAVDAVRGAVRLLGQHGRALHHQGAAPADGADRLGVPRRRPRGGLAAHRAGDGVRRGLARRAEPGGRRRRGVPMVGEAVPALVRRPGRTRAPRRGAARPARGDQAAHRAGHPGRGRDARLRRLPGGAGAAQRAAGRRPAELARAAGHHPGGRTPPARAQPARRRPAEPGVGGAAAADGCRVRRSRPPVGRAGGGVHAAAAGDRRAPRARPRHPPGDPDRPRTRSCPDLARRALPGAGPSGQPGAPSAPPSRRGHVVLRRGRGAHQRGALLPGAGGLRRGHRREPHGDPGGDRPRRRRRGPVSGLRPAGPGRPGRRRGRHLRGRQPARQRHDDQLPGPGPRCRGAGTAVRETVMEPVS